MYVATSSVASTQDQFHGHKEGFVTPRLDKGHKVMNMAGYTILNGHTTIVYHRFSCKPFGKAHLLCSIRPQLNGHILVASGPSYRRVNKTCNKDVGICVHNSLL